MPRKSYRRRHRGGVYHRQDDPIHILTHALRMSGGRRRMRGRGLGSAYRIAYPRDEMGRPLRGSVLNYF